MSEAARLREYAARCQALSATRPRAEARLREFASRVAALRTVDSTKVDSISLYGARARRQVAADARARWGSLNLHAGAARLLDGFAPSLAHLAELTLDEETRFSLLLASLLDPARADRIAERLWPAMFSRLLVRADAARRPRLEARLAHWSPDHVHAMRVDPVGHGAEWNNLDVFARVVDSDGLRFGVVIENKVRSDTVEQPRQLARYHDLVAERFGAVDRTVFIFLTEAPRAMATAEQTALDWHPLLWADVASALGDVAETLSGGWAALAYSARDAIRGEILGLPSAERARRRLVALHARAASARDDSDWARLHSAILDLNQELVDLR